MNFEQLIEKVITTYNSGFRCIVLFMFICATIKGIALYSKKLESKEEKDWDNYVYVIKKETIEMLILIVMFYMLIVFLNTIFSINLFVILNISKYWKIMLSILIISKFKSGKKLYEEHKFRHYLRNVESEKFDYNTPQNILIGDIERFNSNYTLQIERLGILKSMSPISLLPLAAGYVLEGKRIAVNWSWYTIIFYVILLIYFYNIWRCYNNMKFWKNRVWEVQEQLRIINYRAENAKMEF